MSVLAELRQRFAGALARLAPGAEGLAEMVLSSQDAKFGDYQANCAMPLGKQLGKPPREVAQQLIDELALDDLCQEVSIAGPGFINLRLRDDWLTARLQAAVADLDQLGVPTVAKPRTYVVDYSSPNVAKPMHVGHIRSTVIGDALANVLRFLGHRVITDNHIGDWGTQFGMILYGYKHFVDEGRLATAPVDELSRLYRLVNTLIEHHDAIRAGLPEIETQIATQRERQAEHDAAPAPADEKGQKAHAKKRRQLDDALRALEAKAAALREKIAAVAADPTLGPLAAAHADIGRQALLETAKLHAGDPQNTGLWRRFLPDCMAEIQKTYDRLDVTFDHTLGESFYHDRLAATVADLKARGLATEDDGAVCVFLDGQAAPMIVQKQDGAYLYATTDLATIQYRAEKFQPDAILYVVDHRQSLHFEQLFAAAKLWGYEAVELTHVSFGTVLGEDGKPYKTRSGAAVGLMGLLDEAVERALAVAAESPVMTSDAERRAAAERIGIGAIKYADLSHNRTSDYVFSYDKMLAMTGNTAAYMQYSCARVRSIFTRGEVDPAALRASGAQIELAHPAERALGVALVQFAEALVRVAGDYRPNHLTAYLFELASRYSEFFEACPVLKAPTDESRVSRLLLCDLTARTIERGLGLLGIRTVERM